MANMAAQGTQPTSGSEIIAEPITDTHNNIINTYNGNNADENNVDYSSSDGIMVLAQAQTRTAPLTMSSANFLLSGTSTIDMQGIANALVLDDDGDTHISAPTDDQIDISVAGADDFTITANSFNVLASSAIDMADDTQLKFGASDDYWFNYDSANTQFELNATDVDGGGSDGVVFYVADGTDDVVFTGNITATNIAGTLSTAAQTNITSVGTLTSLTLSGTLNVGDNNITNVGDIALDSISSDAGTSITVTLGTDAGDDFIVGNNSALVVEGDNDRVGMGTNAPEFTADIYNASATQLRVYGYSTVGGAGVNSGAMQFGDHPTNYGLVDFSQTGAFYIENTVSGGGLHLREAGANVLSIVSGDVLIGDTSNANMTQGLTINQGANDDEIFALKSSDVAHGMTAITETDTFSFFQKRSATGGGLLVYGLEDANGSNQAVCIHGIGWSESTDDTSASLGIVRLSGGRSDSTSAQGLSATGNILSVDNEGTTRLLLKGNGDLHVTNTTITALDGEDDIALVRASQVAMSNGVGIAMDEWDEHLRASEEDLRRVGVLRGDFINVQRFQSLIGGSVIQLYKRMMQHAKAIEEHVPQLRGKLLPQNEVA